MNKLKFATIAISMFVLGLMIPLEKRIHKSCKLCLDRDTILMSDPPSLQMYFCIEKYAEMYNIPKKFAYGIAYAETRYEGPFDWDYDHARTSSAGAVGPMQIMPRYADPYVDEKKWSTNDLKTNIEMNVKASMRILRKLHNTHGNWKLVFGAYNTGKPCINSYAELVYGYKPNW